MLLRRGIESNKLIFTRHCFHHWNMNAFNHQFKSFTFFSFGRFAAERSLHRTGATPPCSLLYGHLLFITRSTE